MYGGTDSVHCIVYSAHFNDCVKIVIIVVDGLFLNYMKYNIIEQN